MSQPGCAGSSGRIQLPLSFFRFFSNGDKLIRFAVFAPPLFTGYPRDEKRVLSLSRKDHLDTVESFHLGGLQRDVECKDRRGVKREITVSPDLGNDNTF